MTASQELWNLPMSPPRPASVKTCCWSFRGCSLAASTMTGTSDLAVANDFGPGSSNDRRTFRDVASGIGLDASAFGMSVALGDYDPRCRFDPHLAEMFSSAGRESFRRRASERPKADAAATSSC